MLVGLSHNGDKQKTKVILARQTGASAAKVAETKKDVNIVEPPPILRNYSIVVSCDHILNKLLHPFSMRSKVLNTLSNHSS